MRVVVLTDRPDHVCYRYRFRQYVPFLRQAGVTLTPVPWPLRSASRWFWCTRLPDAEVCVIQRRLLDPLSLRVLRVRYPRLIYDFDDAVLYRDSHDPKGPLSLRRAARFRRTVRTVDLVIAGNRYLGGLAVSFGARAVRVIPTSIDTARYIFPSRRERTGRVRCVWIGSASTLPYLEVLGPVLRQLQRQFPELVVRVVCDRFPDWPGIRLERVAWTEAAEARLLAEADIGLAPLPRDPWTAGKCGLKVLQYMAAGLPVVASRTGVHPELVAHGVTGFLVETKGDWVAALRTLIEDAAMRHAMGEHARARVATLYDVRRWAGKLVEALGAGVDDRGSCAVA